MHFISNLLLLSVEAMAAPSAEGPSWLVVLAMVAAAGGFFFLVLYGAFRALEPHRRAVAEYNRNAASQMAKAQEYADNMWRRMHREEKLLTRIADALEKLNCPQEITPPDGPPSSAVPPVPTAHATPADIP